MQLQDKYFWEVNRIAHADVKEVYDRETIKISPSPCILGNWSMHFVIQANKSKVCGNWEQHELSSYFLSNPIELYFTFTWEPFY